MSEVLMIEKTKYKYFPNSEKRWESAAKLNTEAI